MAREARLLDCNSAREGLWPPEQPRLHQSDVAEARAHVEECEECQAYFRQDRALLDVYERVRSSRAPIEVREGVFDALSKARWAATSAEGANRWTRLRVGVLAGAAVVSLAAVGLLATERTHPEAVDDTSVFVEDYLRRAVGQDRVETSDPGEVRRFLQRELGLQLRPFALAGLEIQRVEICLLEGRRGAMIVYMQDGTQISHYLVPREGAEQRAPTLSSYAGAAPSGDMPVVTWATPRVEQALVGELSSRELLRLATLGALES